MSRIECIACFDFLLSSAQAKFERQRLKAPNPAELYPFYCQVCRRQCHHLSTCISRLTLNPASKDVRETLDPERCIQGCGLPRGIRCKLWFRTFVWRHHDDTIRGRCSFVALSELQGGFREMQGGTQGNTVRDSEVSRAFTGVVYVVPFSR